MNRVYVLKPVMRQLARYCGLMIVLLSLVACVRVSQPNEARLDDHGKTETNMNANSQKGIEFKLLKVERAKQGRLVGYFSFKNQSHEVISIPWVTLESEGVGVPNEIGFEVLVDGKWKNPGYYRDAIPMQTTLDAGKSLTLRVDLPSGLWGNTTQFRLLFGKYVSAPSRLDEMK